MPAFLGRTTGSSSDVFFRWDEEGPAGVVPGWPWEFAGFFEPSAPLVASISCFFFA
jgi:hypothetical protein